MRVAATMPKKLRFLGIVLTLILISGSAIAMTGNRLKELCNDTDSSFYDGACLGYIVAVGDILKDGEEDVMGFRACIPTSVEYQQSVDVVRKYLNQHPESLHYGVIGLVAHALSEAFPCTE